MKFVLLIGALTLAMGPMVGAQAAGNRHNGGTNTNSQAQSQTQSAAGSTSSTGNITFEAAEQRRHTSVDTTPNVYAPPSMFGGANNCGQSSSLGVGVTGIGMGGSIASESKSCNAREDTSISYKLGFREVAILRFFCFGEKENRMAYEAAGNKCPDVATAKGLSGAPTTPVAYEQTQNQPMTAQEKAVGYNGNDPIVRARLGLASR